MHAVAMTAEHAPRIGFVEVRAIDGGTVVTVRTATGLRAFLNACPHTGSRLDSVDANLRRDERTFICSVHGAIFDHEGVCIRGPCRGKKLSPVTLPVDELATD